MHVFFEDDGQLKAGTVLADNDTSLQVEAASGKRLKIKAAAVLLRFTAPSPSALLAEAQQLAAELDPDFLWEVSGDGEFGFDELAREYYGHAPTAVEAAAVAQALAAAPMYFYKRGKGRYRKAPPDALKAALASIERKQREAQQIDAWAAELAQGRLPDALRRRRVSLLHRPDKHSLEWKALAAACDAQQTNPLALLAACGAIPSTHEYHFDAFLTQAFPRGTAFPAWTAPPPPPELPLHDVRAFSIDDASTTEIDDAFSVRELPGGNWEVGIHIACPALAIAPRQRARRHRARAAVDRLHARPQDHDAARRRRGDASRWPQARTPPGAVAGTPKSRPTARCCGTTTRVQRVPVAANLRLDALPRPSPTPAVAVRSAVDGRAARAVAPRAATLRRARQDRHPSRRLQLRRRLGRAGSGRRVRPRGDRAAAARQPARQARRRADDPRQQHVGPPPRRRAGRGPVPRRSRRARSR